MPAAEEATRASHSDNKNALGRFILHAGPRVVLRNASGLSYVHGDHLRSGTNTTGAQVSSQRYYPWGSQRGGSSLATPFRFNDQREAPAIGLYYYHARYYDPALGRFISADTIVPEPGNPQDLNRYSYVRNGPCRYVDPSGNCIPEECPGTASNHGLYDDLPISPQQATLAKEMARKFGIPYEFLAAVLQTQQEVDYGFLDAVEDALLQGALLQIKVRPDRVATSPEMLLYPDFVPDLTMSTASLLDLSLGPGQVKISVAAAMEDKFAPAGLLPRSASSYGVIERLETNRGNIGYMAAYLRSLADLRTGRQGPHLTDLGTIDMQIIYGVYRTGIPVGYGSLEAYQSARQPGPVGRLLSQNALDVYRR